MCVQVIGAFFRRWRERRRRRAAIGELRALGDRTLKDMGLTRGEIVAAVDGLVYRGDAVQPRGPGQSCQPAGVQGEPIDPAALQVHLDRARQCRAEFIAGLVRRGSGRAETAADATARTAR
jgi:uncharacterized protein YjiS (DUF1127 family)